MSRTAYAKNVELVGYHDLDGRPGFKLAMQEVDGRFYLYVASFWTPGLSILDVTDPAAPRPVRWVDGPPNTFTIQVQVADGKMITALEHRAPGWGETTADPPPEDGFHVWDVSDPEHPRRLGQWRTGATGTHRNFYAGGRYVHAAATRPGFVGHSYAAVDIADPANPVAVGRWWYPGQADDEPFTEIDERKRTGGLPFPTEAFSLHGGAYVVGDRAYCPWGRAGMVILDISDITRPRAVSVFNVYPPLGSTIAAHTVVPILERNIVVVNDEALNEQRREPLNYAGIVDVSDEADPVLLSLFPMPELPPGAPAGFFDRGGRFGPHNQHQPQGQSCLAPSGDHIYLTYFNAGLQVYDISDVRAPRNVGYFIPTDPTERRAPLPSVLVTQVEDVLVDRRGYAYLTEKNTGVYVVKLTEAS